MTTDPNDRTILCWNDRKIIVEHVTLSEGAAIGAAQTIAKMLGEPDQWQLLDGHLPAHLNQLPLSAVQP